MASLGDTVNKTRRTLEEAGIPDARLEAEVLVANLLQAPRHRIYAFQEQELTPQQEKALNTAMERRLKREPLAYILGHKEFYGIELVLRPGVLIPRPETEQLVEHALFTSLMHMEGSNLVIAEPGTGCGGIAINLAIHIPSARIYSTEISEEALKVAQFNIKQHNVADRVTLLQGDLLQPVPEAVNMIIANLPYVRSEDISTLSPEVQWEPREALDGGPDGLEVIRRMLHQAQDKLKPGGGIILEIDPRQAEPLSALALDLFPDASITMEEDLAHQERIFVIEWNP